MTQAAQGATLVAIVMAFGAFLYPIYINAVVPDPATYPLEEFRKTLDDEGLDCDVVALRWINLDYGGWVFEGTCTDDSVSKSEAMVWTGPLDTGATLSGVLQSGRGQEQYREKFIAACEQTRERLNSSTK